MTWDGENRLTKLELPDGTTEENVYRADGLRHKHVDSGGTIRPIWDERISGEAKFFCNDLGDLDRFQRGEVWPGVDMLIGEGWSLRHGPNHPCRGSGWLCCYDGAGAPRLWNERTAGGEPAAMHHASVGWCCCGVSPFSSSKADPPPTFPVRPC
jgi:YD repeat-containing protein